MKTFPPEESYFGNESEDVYEQADDADEEETAVDDDADEEKDEEAALTGESESHEESVASNVVTHERQSCADAELASSVKSYRLALHAVSNDVEGLARSVEYISAPFHLLVATPSSRAYASQAFAILAEKGRWCKLLNLSDDFDIAKMSEELTEFLEQESDVEKEGIVVNVSGADRFLWKAMEIATLKYENAPQILFDWKNARCQVGKDYIHWKSFELSDGLLDVKTEQSAKFVGSETQQSAITSASDEKLDPPAREEPENGVTSDPSQGYALIEGELETSATEISAVSKQSTSKSREEILKDQELCQHLWDYRKVITDPRDWNDNEHQKKYGEKMTFQDVARAFIPPTRIKIRGEGATAEQSIVLNARNDPFEIQFNSKGKVESSSFKKWSLAEIRRFLGGRWFEEYIYILADHIRKKSKSIKEITINQKIFTHEIDVIVTTASKVFLIECKTGAVDVEVVKKLKNLADTYTSQKKVEAIGLLVSLKPIQPESAVAQFVKQSNRLACMHGDNIPNRMRNLLTTQSKSFLG